MASDFKQIDPNKLLSVLYRFTRITLIFVIFPGIILVIPRTSYSQLDSADEFRFYGNTSLSADFYSMNESGPGNVRARRPATLMRLVVNTGMNYGKFSMPFTMVLSSNQTNFTTPQAPDQSIWQYFQNPMNRITLSPKYDWAQLHLGQYIPDYSDLSTGNTPVFGAGMDLRPGNFQVAAFYGNSQRAIEPDSTSGLPGAFAQRFFATRLAYIGDDGGNVGLNFVRVFDDTNSVDSYPINRFPSSGLLTSLNFEIPVAELLKFYGEGGICYFTRNLFSDDIESDELEFIPDFLNPKYSSRIDYAAKGGLLIKQDIWEIDLSAMYIGDGYEPLGYRFMQSDRIEYTVAPKVRLFDNKLMLRGSIGQRFNNISETKSESSTQLIGSVGAYARITDQLSLAADFSNYGVRNNIDIDTLRIEMVSRAFSITPGYTIRSDYMTHQINATYSHDDFTDFNTVTGRFRSNVTQSLMASYAVRFNEFPLSANISANHVENDLDVGALELNALNLGGSYSFMDNKLQPSLRFSLSQNSIGNNTSDIKFGVRAGIRYEIIDDLMLRLSANINSYDYGSIRNNMAYTETFIQTTLSYRFF